MDKKDIESVVVLLPVAIDLISKLLDLVNRAKDEGVEVPSLEGLKEMNEKLKALEDL